MPYFTVNVRVVEDRLVLVKATSKRDAQKQARLLNWDERFKDTTPDVRRATSGPANEVFLTDIANGRQVIEG